MRKIVVTCALLASTATFTGSGIAAGASPRTENTIDVSNAAVPGKGPGSQAWTGLTKPKDVIVARQELMGHIEELMEPIDTLQVKDSDNLATLRFNGEVISAMLLALPHLFPPTTNLYDPKAEQPETLALPPIWTSFDNFYTLATAASHAATNFAEAEGKPAMKTASLALRASCDACHSLYLRPYVPPKFLDSDWNFDFDSALRRN